MRGLTMDYQLNVPVILRRAETLFGHKQVVTCLPGGGTSRSTYGDLARRAAQLALALRRELHVDPGDRVATFAWNHSEHLEAYFGVPIGGMVLHTLNIRLHPDDLTHIAAHAADRVLIADKELWPLVEQFKDRVGFEHVIVVGSGAAPPGTINLDELLATQRAEDFVDVDIQEDAAAVMCYTSGTTGRPKGVVYSHRAIALHSLALALSGGLAIGESDVCLPVVPMFHANAWGLPFTSALVGATQVLPGSRLDPQSLLEMLEAEHVTFAAGVPTVWTGVLAALDDEPERWDLSSLRAILVGGSAAPRAMIESFERRHGLHVMHAWGMTEMCPFGTLSELQTREQALSEREQLTYRAKQGVPAPFVEIRARGEDDVVPWDGVTMGELEVRGAWVASSYHDSPETSDRWTDDGWFRTGDIVTIDPSGYVEVKDRTKDLVRSGGEWISSVALENALMGHAAVAEAAVIAIPDEMWGERPMALVVLREGADTTPEDLRTFLEPHFAKWWLPDRFELVAELPKTAVGKVEKSALRRHFAPRRDL